MRILTIVTFFLLGFRLALAQENRPIRSGPESQNQNGHAKAVFVPDKINTNERSLLISQPFLGQNRLSFSALTTTSGNLNFNFGTTSYKTNFGSLEIGLFKMKYFYGINNDLAVLISGGYSDYKSSYSEIAPCCTGGTSDAALDRSGIHDLAMGFQATKDLHSFHFIYSGQLKISLGVSGSKNLNKNEETNASGTKGMFILNGGAYSKVGANSIVGIKIDYLGPDTTIMKDTTTEYTTVIDSTIAINLWFEALSGRSPIILSLKQWSYGSSTEKSNFTTTETKQDKLDLLTMTGLMRVSILENIEFEPGLSHTQILTKPNNFRKFDYVNELNFGFTFKF